MAGTDDGRVRPMLSPPHVGELIRESMEEVGWTVGETAARLNCERGTLSRVLNGKAGVPAKMAMGARGHGLGHGRPLDAHAGGLRGGAGASALQMTSGASLYVAVRR